MHLPKTVTAMLQSFFNSKGFCKAKEISYQKFVNRSDVMGGGTLGSIASALLPVKTVDIGIPLLAMHSARELMAACDQQNMVDLVTAYFSL